MTLVEVRCLYNQFHLNFNTPRIKKYRNHNHPDIFTLLSVCVTNELQSILVTLRIILQIWQINLRLQIIFFTQEPNQLAEKTCKHIFREEGG
jgi:hypothetical protein